MQKSGRYAISGQFLVDGSGDQCLEGMAVLVNKTEIEAIVPQSSLPSDLPQESYPGCTILPGLIDCHGHVEDWSLPMYLQHGVTTVRDLANEPRYILDRKAKMSNPEAIGPQIVCYGPALDGYPAIHENLSWAIKTPDDIELAIETLVRMGVDGIKLYARLGAERARRAVAVCRRLGLHVTSHFEGELKAVDAVRLGVLEIQHLHQVPDPFDQKVIDEIVANGTWICPTQSLWEASLLYRRHIDVRKPLFNRIPFGNIRTHSLEFMKNEQDKDPLLEKKQHFCDNQRRYIEALVAAGGKIVAGSDTPCQMAMPGISLIDELVIYTQCGMTNRQALATATGVAARLLKLKTGRLQNGYQADLLVVKGNPLAQITDLYQTQSIYKAGHLYHSGDLAQMDLSLSMCGFMPLIHRVAEVSEDWKEFYLQN